ncbi:hypothetical protein [Acidiphilium sp. JA12-A1]|uniref:hypothetical protein n=1 Tax=Acidiphilium sp. JA12-A1 TaxID=1464546 RepID=UPI000461FBEB|nr:hypothetical protein [Acidiphilium sp. JA12-A1]KDM66914.1 hypothetical protein ACIDI_47c00040 [Acidiphilium sp. JA12-A1]
MQAPASTAPNSQKSRYLFLAPAVIFINAALLCGISLRLGADLNWDLLNYHFLNGYLWLNGKIFSDSICTVQSYLDPLLNSFYYILIDHFSPLAANLIIASLQSLSLSAVWLLCFRMTEHGFGMFQRIMLSSIATLAALISPVFWSEIGGTMGDTLLDTPIIIALWCILEGLRDRRLLFFGIAGALVGFACGLKFTNMVYALAVAGALILTGIFESPSKIRGILLNAFVFSAYSAVAFLATYGYFGWQMWSHFRNPIFPYFNNIFHSPFMAPRAIHDGRWFPVDFAGYLALPFRFAFVHHHTTDNHLVGLEIPFRTLFPALVLILVPAVYFWAYAKRSSTCRFKPSVIEMYFLASFVLLSFIVWEKMFSYYRYFSAIETIAPAFSLVSLARLLSWRRMRSASIAGAALFVALIAGGSLYGTHALADTNWGREQFGRTYFGINKGEFGKYENSLLILGTVPLGFMVPYFPDTDQVIGIPERIPYLTTRFQKNYLKKLSKAKDIYYLSSSPNIERHKLLLAEMYGIHVDFQRCERYHTAAADVAICPARRRTSGLPPLAEGPDLK